MKWHELLYLPLDLVTELHASLCCPWSIRSECRMQMTQLLSTWSLFQQCSTTNLLAVCYLLTLHSSKTEFLLIGVKQQLSTSHTPLIQFAIFNGPPSLTKYTAIRSFQILLFSFSWTSLRSYLDFKTASTIATSNVHFKFNYCNSLQYNLPNAQLNRLLCWCCHNAHKFSHASQIFQLA